MTAALGASLALAAVLAVLGILTALGWHWRHAAVGTVPRIVDDAAVLHEVCSCGAERACGRHERWHPLFGKHS